MPKPNTYIAITGTNTDVGKTFVASQLLLHLKREGLNVSARKPAQSFDKDEPHRLDSEVLSLVTGEDPEVICSSAQTYPIAMAPFMAKRELSGTALYMAEISNIDFQPEVDIGLLEGAGGILSPLCNDGDFLDLMESQKVDIIVCVADSKLGSLNAILTNYFGFRHQIEDRKYSHLAKAKFIVYLNRYDEHSRVDRLNYEWLQENLDLPIFINNDELCHYIKNLSM